MALSPSVLASLIQSNLQASGANGSNLSKFCTAIATGIVQSIVGKSFATIDTGLTTGTGNGVGVGIQSLSQSSMKSIALGIMHSKGSNADPMMQAIMDATVMHLQTATLITTNAPVYSGTGVVSVGSIAVVSSEMSSNIDSQLQAVGAQGSNRAELARAIGTGICTNILSSGTGLVNITGTLTISPPIQGSGSGTGIIS